MTERERRIFHSVLIDNAFLLRNADAGFPLSFALDQPVSHVRSGFPKQTWKGILHDIPFAR
jgi:hypothetical protein